MKQGTHIILYKRKGLPVMTAYVVDDLAKIALPLEEFQALLVKEIGQEEKVAAAFEAILKGMKEGATVIV